MDVMKEDMKMAGITEDEAKDRVILKQMICCGDPQREEPKEEVHYLYL